MTQEDGAVHWVLPKEGTVKVNTDAAIFSESNCYSFAMVARSHKEDLVEAKSCCRQGSISPELAEVMGLREALSWIKMNRWPVVDVETDCLLIVQAISSESATMSYFGRLIEECKHMLGDFKDQKVSVRFIKRSANKVAVM